MTSNPILAIFAASVATVALLGALDAAAKADTGNDVETLVRRASDAHASLMRGDVQRYRQAIELTADFTLMDPFGGRPGGAPASEEQWQRLGRFFRAGRDARFELIHAYHSADLVVLVANERAHVAVGSLSPQRWALRVTLVFRRDGGKWRLAHRHADPLVQGISLDQAGRLGGAM